MSASPSDAVHDAAERSRRPAREPGYVYPAREDTTLLASCAPACTGRTVLEIGTGSGAVALAAARHGAVRVVATDLNPNAVRLLRARASAERLPIDAVQTDLAAGLGRFDIILANPPYLPTVPGARDPDRLANLALDGGPDGCGPIARIIRTLPRHLLPGGRAFVLVSTVQSRARRADLAARWRRRGGRLRVFATRALEGEELAIWELTPGRPRRAGLRTRRPSPGTPSRPRSRPGSPRGSSRAPGPGRTRALGGASGRRRSRRGS